MLNAVRLLAISTVTLSMIACSSSSPTGFSSGSTSGSGSTSHSGGSSSSKSGSTTGSHSSTHSSGSGSASTSSTSSGPETPGSFCTKIVAAEAALISKCLSGPVSAWNAQLSVASPCTELNAAVTAGRVTFDEGEAAGCLAAYAQISCAAASSPAPSACAATLTGTVAAGGTCYGSVDCSGDSYCQGLGGATSVCMGTCAAKLASGATCTAGEQCVTGFACDGTCKAIPAAPTPAAAGATCGYSSTTKTITTCATGLSCDALTLKCVATINQGSPCTPGAGICETFTDCDPTSKTCKPYPGVGGDCGQAAGQDFINCAAGTYCDVVSGTAAGKCAALLGTSAACVFGVECASGACSGTDGGMGTCYAACTQE